MGRESGVRSSESGVRSELAGGSGSFRNGYVSDSDHFRRLPTTDSELQPHFSLLIAP